MEDHTLKSDETLADVANRHRLLWETLWDAPINAGLREKRKYAENVQPGDIIRIPQPRLKGELASTDQAHTFRIKKSELRTHWIELELLDEEDRPQAQEPYWIRLANGMIQEGLLNDQGIVRIDRIPAGMSLVKFPTIDREEWEVASSPVKPVQNWIEIRVIDNDNRPLAGEDYSVELPNGEIRSGKLDSNGLARIEAAVSGVCTVLFPNIDEDEWDDEKQGS